MHIQHNANTTRTLYPDPQKPQMVSEKEKERGVARERQTEEWRKEGEKEGLCGSERTRKERGVSLDASTVITNSAPYNSETQEW